MVLVRLTYISTGSVKRTVEVFKQKMVNSKTDLLHVLLKFWIILDMYKLNKKKDVYFVLFFFHCFFVMECPSM